MVAARERFARVGRTRAQALAPKCCMKQVLGDRKALPPRGIAASPHTAVWVRVPTRTVVGQQQGYSPVSIQARATGKSAIRCIFCEY